MVWTIYIYIYILIMNHELLLFMEIRFYLELNPFTLIHENMKSSQARNTHVPSSTKLKNDCPHGENLFLQVIKTCCLFIHCRLCLLLISCE